MRTTTRRTETARGQLPWLWGLACRLVGEHEAEVLVRDCLARALTGPQRAEAGRARLLDSVLAGLRDQMPHDFVDDLPDRQLIEPRRSAVTASATAAVRALGDRELAALLDRLSPPVRVVLVLVHGEGLGAGTVAEALGVPTARVHAWLGQGQLVRL